MAGILFLGDIHGDFGSLAGLLAEQRIAGETIVQVGDFGVGFRPLDQEREMLAGLNRLLEESNSTLYALRGNHDDPALFGEGSPLNQSNLKLLADYSVVEVDGRKVLVAGGAISVDRLARKARGHGYWPGEAFKYDEAKLAGLDLTNLWAVATHAAPAVAPPYEIKTVVSLYLIFNPALKEDLVEERRGLDKLLEAVLRCSRPKYWVYGHYHRHMRTEHRGIEFVTLDVGQAMRLD